MADEHGGDGGLIANGMRVVNAIPFVCDTEPGVLDTLDIPAVVSRNVRFLSAPSRACREGPQLPPYVRS